MNRFREAMAHMATLEPRRRQVLGSRYLTGPALYAYLRGRR